MTINMINHHRKKIELYLKGIVGTGQIPFITLVRLAEASP